MSRVRVSEQGEIACEFEFKGNREGSSARFAFVFASRLVSERVRVRVRRLIGRVRCVRVFAFELEFYVYRSRAESELEFHVVVEGILG